MAKYRNRLMEQLKDHQVRNVPLKKRLGQVDRAERLLGELKAGQTYRYQDLYERITSSKPQAKRTAALSGEDALHDLRLLVEDVTDSADIAAEDAGEPVYTIEEVSQRFNVSTKTVDRWRLRGLASRRFRFGNRKRIGFLKSSIDRFVREHADEVRRGEQFSQITEEERQEILDTARRLAESGGGLSHVVARVAEKFGRSAEAIRYTIKHHDQEHPDEAVFPHAWTELTGEQKEEIYRSLRRGVPASRLAREYSRSEAAIDRVAHDMRVKELVETPIDFMDNEEFHQPDAEEKILTPPPEGPQQKGRLRPPPGLPPYLASLYEAPLLNKEQETYYFRKMNYLKYRASCLQQQVDPQRPRARDLDRIEELLNEATKIRNLLTRRNLRLVVSISKKYFKAGTNFFEIVSDGNVSLMRAIDKFDYSKGFKLSTYASWAIIKNFSRSMSAEHSHLDRFRTGNEELFQDSQDVRSNQFEQEQVNRKQREVLMGFLDQLDERERDIIAIRYGLERGTEPQTLEEIGNRLGVSKERIRQLESRALRKLREIAAHEKLEIPGV